MFLMALSLPQPRTPGPAPSRQRGAGSGAQQLGHTGQPTAGYFRTKSASLRSMCFLALLPAYVRLGEVVPATAGRAIVLGRCWHVGVRAFAAVTSGSLSIRACVRPVWLLDHRPVWTHGILGVAVLEQDAVDRNVLCAGRTAAGPWGEMLGRHRAAPSHVVLASAFCVCLRLSARAEGLSTAFFALRTALARLRAISRPVPRFDAMYAGRMETCAGPFAEPANEECRG